MYVTFSGWSGRLEDFAGDFSRGEDFCEYFFPQERGEKIRRQNCETIRLLTNNICRRIRSSPKLALMYSIEGVFHKLWQGSL